MKLRIREEQITREMTLEGVASILEGMNPHMLETKLLGFLVEARRVRQDRSRGKWTMSRRKRDRAHANHDRWLVSYADFITLIFAFFVVLYASAQVDQRKVGRLALAIQVAFQELGVFPASTHQVPFDVNEPMPFSTVQTIENAKRNAELDDLLPSRRRAGAASERSQSRDPAGRIAAGLAARNRAAHRRSTSRDRRLVISLREFGFFDSGSAALKPSAVPALDRIASILAVRSLPPAHRRPHR